MANDDTLEKLVRAMDSCTRATRKRMRETELEAARRLKKPEQVDYPFNKDYDVLNACLEGIETVTGAYSPQFDTQSEPTRVFAFVRDVIIAYGDECREEGRNLERASSDPRVRPELAMELLKCMRSCNSLLSTAAPEPR